MAPIPQSKEIRDWMSKIDENTILSKIAIPGTHNSEAWHISFPSVQCQGASITDQLNHGVRFLDIRCASPFFTGCGGILGSSEQELQVIHGNFPVKIPVPAKLSDALQEVYDFLEHNSSETVLVSLKPEGPKQWAGDDFANLLWDNYIKNKQNNWYLHTEIPKLKDCRGKAVLFRRFGCSDDSKKNSYGIDASWWKYNTTEDDRGKLVVQDWCEVMEPSDIDKKRDYIAQHLKRAVEYNSTSHGDDQAKLYVNFCSGSNFWNPQCWPRQVSVGVKNIDEGLGSGCGIVIVDFAETNDWETVRKLVAQNL